VVGEDGPRRTGAVAPSPSGVLTVIAGRATSVPFAAVLTGPERTATDNTTAVATCGIHRLHR